MGDTRVRGRVKIRLSSSEDSPIIKNQAQAVARVPCFPCKFEYGNVPIRFRIAVKALLIMVMRLGTQTLVAKPKHAAHALASHQAACRWSTRSARLARFLLRNLLALFAGFGKSDGNRLLAVRYFLAGPAAFQRAFGIDGEGDAEPADLLGRRPTWSSATRWRDRRGARRSRHRPLLPPGCASHLWYGIIMMMPIG